jgi:hypothetical protein
MHQGIGWTNLSAADDDATVEYVYKYISENIGLKPGRKLLLTSGCNILEDSKTLLPQVQNEESCC